jgi:hypothetical protein
MKDMPYCPEIKSFCVGKSCICFVIRKNSEEGKNDVFCMNYERSFSHWKRDQG